MNKRIASGIIGFILLVGIVIKGGILLKTSLFLVTLLGTFEFNNAVKRLGISPINFMSYLFPLGLYVIFMYNVSNLIQLYIFLYSLGLVSLLVLKENIKLPDIATTLLGSIYISFFIFHILYLEGSMYIWIVFITAWATDTFAFLAGKLFGKSKLCPNLSPNKTVEGAIGGILGSLLITIMFVTFFNIDSMLKLAILSVICSVMAQIGDLTASRIKRLADIKDYGNIMPGHGGMLDRFDSILFTAPIVYYYLHYFI